VIYVVCLPRLKTFVIGDRMRLLVPTRGSERVVGFLADNKPAHRARLSDADAPDDPQKCILALQQCFQNFVEFQPSPHRCYECTPSTALDPSLEMLRA